MVGAGGIIGANHIYSAAPKDGLTIGSLNNITPFEPLYGTKEATFEPRKFIWLGSPGYETGTLAHELLAGFVAAVDYLGEVGWEFILERERALGQRFLDGLPSQWKLHGPATMDGRVATFGLTSETEAPAAAAERLGNAGYAVWHGDNYALEIMKRLQLPDGVVRVGILHPNTEAEIDGLLAELAR